MFQPDSIIQGDSLKILRQLPDNCIDVIFADPPYFMQLGGELFRPDSTHVNAVTDDWDKFDDFKTYDDFTIEWLTQARRVLKDDGSLWVIGSYHNIFRVGYHLQNIGFWLLNDIIWVKTNPMPNFRGTRFTNAHETLIWCAKSEKSKYTFNYDAMKSLNEGLQMRSDWNLPICSGAERLKDLMGKKVHTTQKPESLLYRVILASTKPGDVILDPFFGTGTTGAVAKKLGRHYIGIEKEATYIKYAQKRLSAINPVSDDSVFELPSKRTEPRIPFGSLIAHGLINVGDCVFDSKRRFKATVMSDGSLKKGRDQLSIHQMAAKVQGVPSANGWLFWHIEKKRGLIKKTVSLDDLRQQLKKDLLS